MTDSGKRQSFGKGMAIRDTADDKPRPDLTVNVQFLNLLSRRVEQSRQYFFGPRNNSGVDFTDIHSVSAGPLFKLKIIKSFS